MRNQRNSLASASGINLEVGPEKLLASPKLPVGGLLQDGESSEGAVRENQVDGRVLTPGLLSSVVDMRVGGHGRREGS